MYKNKDRKRTVLIYFMGQKHLLKTKVYESKINEFILDYTKQVQENKFDVGCGQHCFFNIAMITHIKVK